MELITLDQDEERLAAMLKALGHPLRLGIVRFVATHPGCICNEIVIRTKRAQSTISQHLHILQSAGLIEAIHDGNTTSYYLDRQALSWLQKALAMQVST
ncbi:MAG: transcriptional regulator [Herpetosiphonaceae bacterium]|nr:MAG: transcriptional regulator [Herpetosiphonaceae bacterium]